MRKEFVSKDDLMFTDVMAPGVKLIASHSLLIPEYLVIRNKQAITLESFESYEIITMIWSPKVLVMTPITSNY